ncbi:MAG: hypothetical protein NTX90_13370 [Alphaproteobacteria bacterium]|nr:hypothetical protein [Alphaproteobacteria bacterium]
MANNFFLPAIFESLRGPKPIFRSDDVGGLHTPVFRQALPEVPWFYVSAAGGIVNNTALQVRAAAGAGLRNYVQAIQLTNANAVATEFLILDNVTPLWRGFLPASNASTFDFEFIVPLRGTANTILNVQCVTTGAQVYANLQGYSAP